MNSEFLWVRKSAQLNWVLQLKNTHEATIKKLSGLQSHLKVQLGVDMSKLTPRVIDSIQVLWAVGLRPFVLCHVGLPIRRLPVW